MIKIKYNCERTKTKTKRSVTVAISSCVIAMIRRWLGV